jgi:uncharacterized SAM-binding protein YcdF (DUF218 family)
MNYWVKQVVAALATPLVLALVLAAVALICVARRRPRAATWLGIAAALVMYLGSIVPVGNALLGPLERRYPPLSADVPLPPARYVMVLGSSYSPHEGIPVSGALDPDGLARIVEGVVLAKRLRTGQLIVSGGAPKGRTPSALGYAAMARELGVDPASIVVLDQSLDTGDEAFAVVRLIGRAPFLLVTSASHMPRAVELMRRAGAHPIAAPAGHRVRGVEDVGARAWLPNARGLRKTEQALHEYMGLLLLAAEPG